MAPGRKRAILLRRIMEIDDPSVLDHVQAVLDLRSDDWWESLPVRMKASIEKSLDDSKRDRVRSHADVMKRARAWARK